MAQALTSSPLRILRPGRDHRSRRGVASGVIVTCLFAGTAFAQGPSAAIAAQAGQSAPAPPSAFSRWIDVQTANFQLRYRYIETTEHVVSTRQMQDGAVLKARLKLDRAGRFTVTAGGGTGGTFTSSWNNSGLGTGDRVDRLWLKQLSVGVIPVAGVELSYGGLAPVRGESTEITSYDNDGFVVGERISVRRPKRFYFDEISGTAAYLGDISTPNVFRRFDRLDRVNYGQFLVSKKLTPWLAASTDVTRLAHVSTVRAAAAVTLHHQVVDTVRYEQYARAGDNGAFGFAASGEKAALPRLLVSAGVANIDRDYGGLNGDRYNRGRRVFGSGTVRLSPELSLLLFGTRSWNDQVSISNHTRFDVVLTYNAIASLRRSRLIR